MIVVLGSRVCVNLLCVYMCVYIYACPAQSRGYQSTAEKALSGKAFTRGIAQIENTNNNKDNNNNDSKSYKSFVNLRHCTN